jgi:hypothetical protein
VERGGDDAGRFPGAHDPRRTEAGWQGGGEPGVRVAPGITAVTSTP